MSPAPIGPELQSLKDRLKVIWSSGNWNRFSQYTERSSEEFLERLDVRPGTKMLDVACGSGTLCLMAARRGAEVAGIDLTEASIDAARSRAQEQGLNIRFEQGDAEALPYADASFDLVTSIFGAMFAPRPEVVADELLRVCRPGGTIAMGNWTPEGFIGKMFKIFAKFIAPAGMPSPVLWGNEETVRQRFGSGVSSLRMERVNFTLDFPFPPAEVVEFFRQNYGPTTRAFESLGADQQKALRSELEQFWSANNRASDGSTAVDGEYLFVSAIRA